MKFLKNIKKIEKAQNTSFYVWVAYLLLALISFAVTVSTRSIYALFGFMFFAWYTIMQHQEYIYWRGVHRKEYIKQSRLKDWEKQVEEWRRRGRT